jgi:hypothetical protein
MGSDCGGRIGSAALGGFGQALGGTTDGGDVALVEVTDLDTVGEGDPVAQPVETVGQDDLALRALGNAGVEVDRALHPVPDLQIELVGMGLGKRVRLPIGHGHSLPDERADR